MNKLVPLDVVMRITAYLSDGGLFNPECAIHDNVRDLLIDARAALNAAPPPVEPDALRQAAIEAAEYLELPGSGIASVEQTLAANLRKALEAVK